MKKLLFITFLGMAMILAGCNSFKKTTTETNQVPDGHNSQSALDGIKEKYWKLVSINDRPVTVLGKKEAHIILKEDGKLIGHGGCNALFGTYKQGVHDKISFKNIGSTEMMCEAMKTEEELIRVLQTTDSYLVKQDTLFLHKGRMAPLARFEAVYLY